MLFDHYIDLLKSLMELNPVASWMQQHISLLAFLERDLYSRKRLAPQLRSEVATLRGDGVQRNLEFITKHGNEFQGYFTMGFGQTCLSLFH